jgi:hypothetical protein
VAIDTSEVIRTCCESSRKDFGRFANNKAQDSIHKDAVIHAFSGTESSLKSNSELTIDESIGVERCHDTKGRLHSTSTQLSVDLNSLRLLSNTLMSRRCWAYLHYGICCDEYGIFLNRQRGIVGI